MAEAIDLAKNDYRFVVGIDPDSKAHGVAVYDAGVLMRCESITTQDLVVSILPNLLQRGGVIVIIEDVLENKFIYARNTRAKKQIETTIAQQVGRCKQAEYELLQWCNMLKIKVVKQAPKAGNWAKNKELFEQRTGWKGRSNEDGRSAAFFGYILLQMIKSSKQRAAV